MAKIKKADDNVWWGWGDSTTSGAGEITNSVVTLKSSLKISQNIKFIKI